MDLTLVTAYFDLNKNCDNKGGATWENKYYENFKILSKLEIPFVIYISKEYEKKIINDLPKNNKIVNMEYNDLIKSRDNDRLKENIKKNKVLMNSKYIIVTCSKYDLMENAINENYFNTKHFAWVDFGLAHVCKNITMENMKISLNKSSDKLSVGYMNLPSLAELDDIKSYYSRWDMRVVGGFLMGTVESWRNVIPIFNKIYNDSLDAGLHGDDEYHLAIALVRNPELFDPYLSNYYMAGLECREYMPNIDYLLSIVDSLYNKKLYKYCHIAADDFILNKERSDIKNIPQAKLNKISEFLTLSSYFIS